MRRALDISDADVSKYITTTHGQPGYGHFGKHAGYDYGVVRWAVRAPEAGIITTVYIGRERVEGGNIIELRGQYTHRFLHLQNVDVSVGQNVAKGQQLGITGNTGNVGFHLHHDTRKNGTTWTAVYANYVDWEALIKQGGEMPIPDQDNYYWRYGQKLAQQVRGRSLSREEFRKYIVGRTDLQAVESLSDNVEADQATQAQSIGLMAMRDNWQGQIYGLQAQLAELGKRPTQQQLDDLNAQAAELKASAAAAQVAVEVATQKMNEATIRAQEVEASQDADKSAADTFLRRVGQFIKKYL